MNMWEHLGKRRKVSCVATALHKLNSSPHSAPCRISRKRKRKVKNVNCQRLNLKFLRRNLMWQRIFTIQYSKFLSFEKIWSRDKLSFLMENKVARFAHLSSLILIYYICYIWSSFLLSKILRQFGYLCYHWGDLNFGAAPEAWPDNGTKV